MASSAASTTASAPPAAATSTAWRSGPSMTLRGTLSDRAQPLRGRWRIAA